jgi:protein TonB
VLIRAKIGKDGRIENAEVVSSPDPSLSAAALDAVRQWRYRPYVLNGQTVEADTPISVIFTDPAPVPNSSGGPQSR